MGSIKLHRNLLPCHKYKGVRVAASHPYARPQCVKWRVTALQNPMVREHCGIFWDFDNETVGLDDLPGRLALIQRVAGMYSTGVLTFRVYANPVTLRSVGPQSVQALVEAGAELPYVSLGREAADIALESEAFVFSSRFREKSCVIIISKDNGFTGLIRYLRYLGCLTVVIGRFSGAYGMRENQMVWRSLPLPSTAHVAFDWTDITELQW
eukprot:jgi/Botrbrau1/18390/Bobra.152_1s0002.1